MGSGSAGGVQTFVQEVVRHIDRERFHISVCITGEDGPVGDRLRAAGVEVFRVDLDRPPRGVPLAAFARRVFAGRYDLLHVNGGGAALRLVGRLAGCPAAITHVHGFPNEWVETMRLGRPLNPALARTYGWGSRRILACSRFMERTLVEQFPSLNGRIECLVGGVDLDRFQPRVEAFAGRGGADRVVGYVGRLSPEKGVREFLEAARAVLRNESAVRFVIVGDGPLRAEVESEAARWGAGRIELLGERDDVETILPGFDVVAVPSRIDAFGLVSVEAMASGRPVVAFAVGGIPEVVVPGETGLLVAPGDTAAFARAVLDLLRREEERERMGRAGRARAEALFDVRRTVRTLEDIYEGVLRGGGG